MKLIVLQLLARVAQPALLEFVEVQIIKIVSEKVENLNLKTVLIALIQFVFETLPKLKSGDLSEAEISEKVSEFKGLIN